MSEPSFADSLGDHSTGPNQRSRDHILPKIAVPDTAARPARYLRSGRSGRFSTSEVSKTSEVSVRLGRLTRALRARLFLVFGELNRPEDGQELAGLRDPIAIGFHEVGNELVFAANRALLER